MMRILITGAQGQLGSALQRAMAGEDLILKDLPDFDLNNPDCEKQIREARPAVVLHVGAYTNVDGAEREPDRAHKVNVEGTTYVARAAQALRARVVYVSTDYVFDGTKTSPYTEDDSPNPLNQYGRSKHEGERAVLSLCPNSVVVRTAWLFGHDGSNFVKTIARLARERPLLDVVADQRGCPTYADDLARAIQLLLTSDRRGIYHVTNGGACSWYEFAQAIVRLIGLSTVVRPITTEESGRPAKRPAYSVLSPERFSSHFAPLPPWQDALGRYMKRVPHLVSPA
jgi:dTDP-4-dehydrorhamnose reductase